MINFPFGTNGNSIILGVPILKHITVYIYNVISDWLRSKVCVRKGGIGTASL